jgi:MFS family permease
MGKGAIMKPTRSGTFAFKQLFSWWQEAEPRPRRALIAAALGWMLDAFDVMLYSMIIANLMVAFRMDKETAGLLGSLTLIAAAVGGMVFGFIADRYGRTKAMMAAIAIYSVFTAACGLSATILQLAIFRFLLGLGMGGEWSSGAALVGESWPAVHRAKAMGLMQSFYAVGYALAALTVAVVLPAWGWRPVFFVGILPAFLIIWIRSRVQEPDIWVERKLQAKTSLPEMLRVIFGRRLRSLTIVVTLMNAFTMFAWWGFNLWIPAYLILSQQKGGMGLTRSGQTWLIVVMQFGMWLGYLTFGFISDRFGRKRVYVVFLTGAALLLFLYSLVHSPALLFFLGPLVAFFGTGHFSGFGALTAEIYPTQVRATAQGFTYNIGRIMSAVAPFAVGSLAQTRGFGAAFAVAALSFFLAALMWIWIPETGGKALE